MKILAITGSYRKNGNTAHIVNLVLSEIQRTGLPVEVETIFLGDLDLGNCRGCRACFDRGEEKCPLKDDLASVKARMLAADGLIVASPIYVDDVSGIAKTWIDRLAHLCHRPALDGKPVLLLTTVAGSTADHAQRTLNSALRTWGAQVAGQANFRMGALMERGEVEERFQIKAAQLAGKLSRAIQSRAFERPSIFSLAIFRVQQLAWRKAKPGTLDYQHWQGRGWLDKDCAYYVPPRASKLTIALGRLAGTLLYKVVA